MSAPEIIMAAAGASPAVTYIEDVFSTYLYTGNGSTQTINNGIDLAGKGGLVWIKARNQAWNNWLSATDTGVSYSLISNSTAALTNIPTGGVSAFNVNGFDVSGNNQLNSASGNFASWTFRKQPKFFDVVTWTGNNASSRTVSHSLGSTPGFILIKNLTTAEDWVAWHKDAANGWTGALNSTTEFTRSDNNCNGVTSTTFNTNKNSSPDQYVAYLFAHNAGGFGLTGTDNVISCGSYTGSSGIKYVDLGYEPQFILWKTANTTSNWQILDNMRPFANNNGSAPNATLFPNTSGAESTAASTGYIFPTATGFADGNSSSANTYIYIAIRRGPMKVPTDATKVFSPALGQSPNPNYVSGFPVDLGISEYRVNGSNSTGSRLQGSNIMDTASTNAESSDGSTVWDFMNGYYTGGRTSSFVSWMFRRAPGFFDEVCYTGNDTNRTINHNLGVAPEMMIVKSRVYDVNWAIYHSGIGPTKSLYFTSGAQQNYGAYFWNSTAPTSTVFSLGPDIPVNSNATGYVAYLFATCAGVSKVGSYTGTGALQTVNCGFAAGARFVLIKRTDSTGDWYVYDSARGITSGNDPYLLLNSTAAEVTGTNYVDTDASGFKVTAAAPAGLNANGGTYIFLAIA